ncbi:hypothetical protein [Aquitalea sp. FJL05]|uniref:hypothetical protein n=1 Tax=Aquitalea sp. FJL05 TaxID=2153366 RepID=UPI000F595435|nr:hypothetical protein [Aquitalea sp. FJL05]
MSNLISCLRQNINHHAVKRFDSKKIEFIEPDKSAKLRKLIIKASKPELLDQHPKDGIFIELDHSNPLLENFTHFLKSGASGINQKVDFCLITQKDNTVYFVISDLKSSTQGNNDRCAGQYKNTKLFINYITEIFESFELTQAGLIKKFFKLLFIPNEGIATSLPISPCTEDSIDILKNEPECNFHLVNLEDGVGEISLNELLSRLPS